MDHFGQSGCEYPRENFVRVLQQRDGSIVTYLIPVPLFVYESYVPLPKRVGQLSPRRCVPEHRAQLWCKKCRHVFIHRIGYPIGPRLLPRGEPLHDILNLPVRYGQLQRVPRRIRDLALAHDLHDRFHLDLIVLLLREEHLVVFFHLLGHLLRGLSRPRERWLISVLPLQRHLHLVDPLLLRRGFVRLEHG